MTTCREALYNAVEQKNLDEVCRLLQAGVTEADIAVAAALLAAWPQAALDDLLYELAWRAARYQAPPWTDAQQALATALLDAGANPGVRSKDYNLTPLHYAAEKHNLAFVTLLLAHGAEVNATTTEEPLFSGHRRTPLYVALREKYNETEHLPVIRALLKAGANPNINAYTSPPDTTLTLALEHGELETAKLLVAHGAHINRKRPPEGGASSRTLPVVVATEYAVKHNDLGQLNWLLKIGANPNVKVQFDVTPLGIAAESGNLAVIQALIQAGADINWQQGSALTAAAQSEEIEAVRYLLEQGATPHIRALGAAIHNSDLVMVQLLVERGVPLDKRSTYTDNKLPLAYAREYPEMNADIIAYLLSILTDRDPQTTRRQTQQHHNTQLLKVAVDPCQEQPIAHWLELGANPNTMNEYGRAALHYVVERGRAPDDVRLLLNAGAKVNARDAFGYTPLHDSVLGDNAEIIQLLLDAGADPAARVERGIHHGHIALEIARIERRENAIRLLTPLSPEPRPLTLCEPELHEDGSVKGFSHTYYEDDAAKNELAKAGKRGHHIFLHEASLQPKWSVADARQPCVCTTHHEYGAIYQGAGISRAEHPLRWRIAMDACLHCGSEEVFVTYAKWGVQPHSGNAYWNYAVKCTRCGYYSNWGYDDG